MGDGPLVREPDRQTVPAASSRNIALGVLLAGIALALLFHARPAPAKSHTVAAPQSNRFIVRNAHYDLFSGDLTKVASVWFTLTPGTPHHVLVRLDAYPGDWVPCSRRPDRFVCALPVPVDLASVTRFDVQADG